MTDRLSDPPSVSGSPAQGPKIYRRKSDGLIVKAAPSVGWQGWMKVYLPDGDAYRVIAEEFDRDFEELSNV